MATSRVSDSKIETLPLKKLSKGTSIFFSQKLSNIPGLWHGFFTRRGGYSPPPFDSLNVALRVGDNPDNVYKNIELIKGESGFTVLISLHQVHGNRVVLIDKENSNSLIGDALITDRNNIGLMVKVADCQPILLCEPKRKVVAAIHSGWRGNVQNIIKSTIDILKSHFNILPGRIIAAIGPSLGPCCAEFVNYKHELPENFLKFKVSEHHFDFWAISKQQLLDVGIPEKNIEILKICTYCNANLLFSYRREKTTGRIGAVIGFLL